MTAKLGIFNSPRKTGSSFIPLSYTRRFTITFLWVMVKVSVWLKVSEQFEGGPMAVGEATGISWRQAVSGVNANPIEVANEDSQ